MHDPRLTPNPDAILDPLLERLAFVETANHRLKDRLSERSFNAEFRNAALREQLEQAKAELARQQEALDNFCRAILSAARERDQAQAEAKENLKLRDGAMLERDGAMLERDELSRRLDQAQQALAGAEARESDVKGRIEEALREAGMLKLQLDIALRDVAEMKRERDAALHAAKLLELQAGIARKEKEEAAGLSAQQLRERDAALRAAEENGRLIMAAKEENDRRVLAAMEAQLEWERRDARGAQRALRQSLQACAEVQAPADFPAPAALEGLLDPVWVKALAALRSPIVSAYARLRQLNLAAIGAGPRAMIRLAAVSLTQTSDMLKTLEEFFDESSFAAEPGRAEAALEKALASWENAFKQRRIEIVRRVESNLPQVLLREEPLRVAVFQVLWNAYEAMPRGGILTVQASRQAETGAILVRFSDTGPGFAPKTLDHLFTPFGAVRPGHLGLGLCLARRIVRRFGGEVSAANAPNKKGAFIVLKLVEAPPAKPSLAGGPDNTNP